jgi:hypothetical protein
MRNNRMRRVPRILLTAATAVLLVLGVAVVALWVRSYWCRDGVGIEHNAPNFWRIEVTSAPQGCVTIVYHSASFPPRPGARERWYFKRTTSPPVARWDLLFSRRPVRWEFAGFVYAAPPSPRGERFRILTFPLWFASAVLAAPLALAIRLIKRKRAAKSGRCLSCGYDLRATPDRCPECGRAVPPGPSA